MPHIRPRFSLLTALMFVTIVGMAIVVVQLWHEVGPLRAENKRLNEERGRLVIGDPNVLQAIEIPARFAGEDRRSYRVYVPPGQSHVAFVQVNNIPKDGFPERTRLPDDAGILGGFQGRLFGRLRPGEHIVTIRTTRRGGKADIALVVDFLDASTNTPKDRWPTVVPETYSVFGGGVGGITVAAEKTEPLVLLRQRIMGIASESFHVSYTTAEPDVPLDGVLCWIERTQ